MRKEVSVIILLNSSFHPHQKAAKATKVNYHKAKVSQVAILGVALLGKVLVTLSQMVKEVKTQIQAAVKVQIPLNLVNK